MTTEAGRQPYLHDLLVALRAPAMALTDAAGQIGSDGPAAPASVQAGTATGIYLSDRRILSEVQVSVDGAELRPIDGQSDSASGIGSLAVLSGLGDPGADPSVLLSRQLRVHRDRVSETFAVSSTARAPVGTRLQLQLACDLADLASVKSGRPVEPLAPAELPTGLRWTGPDGSTVQALATPAPQHHSPGKLSWDVQLQQGQTVTIELTYTLTGDPTPQVVLAPEAAYLRAPTVTSPDLRLSRLIERSMADLAALELADPHAPGDHFLAAGLPWYLTLFGRDSLIAARLLLPLGTELAAGTLRALARRQGSRIDLDAAEEPGKILHELRRADTVHGSPSRAAYPLRLPPTYYGTVDATPLWILLLHDSWLWGMPAGEVAELVPNLESALAWLRDYAMDGSGFLRYQDRSGHGLANQGWKDSHDAVQFRDGRLAEGPVALAEVQAYGYAAARAGARLLSSFGRPGAEDWLRWAKQLADRFRDRFWVSDADGDYPALALDGHGRPVDALTSNIGHLLGTGLLDRDESALVARRLGPGPLATGFGLRTLAGTAAGFNPLSYHAGSVWPHDTAIAVLGLADAAADGVPDAEVAAGGLIEGLLAAAAGFDYRLPELFSGAARVGQRRPAPYPASCRPQAWSAAASIAILTAALGPRPDAPAGTIEFRPLAPSPFGELIVGGLRFNGNPLAVALDRRGTVRIG